MQSQIQPLPVARTLQTRTLFVVAVMGAILGGLIVFASVQVSRGNPTPRSLMVTKSPVLAPTVVLDAAAPTAAPVDTVESIEAIESVEPVAASIEQLVAWQTAGDPPLPDHHPWEEMQQATPAAATPTFNGRPIRKARAIRMLVTAYSPDEQSCGIFADGITASGFSVYTNGMKLVAADTRLLPFGSIVSVPGYNGGRPVPVLDRGGKIRGRRLDVLYPTHQRALQWGSQHLEVTVWEYAD
jgi:3D (Asp-Asp-Asp) domain-containing protein